MTQKTLYHLCYPAPLEEWRRIQHAEEWHGGKRNPALAYVSANYERSYEQHYQEQQRQAWERDQKCQEERYIAPKNLPGRKVSRKKQPSKAERLLLELAGFLSCPFVRGLVCGCHWGNGLW